MVEPQWLIAEEPGLEPLNQPSPQRSTYLRLQGPWPLPRAAARLEHGFVATRIAAWLAAAGFLLVAAFQLALVLGAPWGEYTQGGATGGALAPSGRIIAAVSCLVSILMTGAILARAGEVRCGDCRLGW